MANKNRLYRDKNGRMFIPMNVEGNSWDEHFFNTPKLIIISSILAVAVMIWIYLGDKGASISGYLTLYTIWFIGSIYIVRFFVFEERYYYKMYKQLKKDEITTPALFWNIVSMRDNGDGAVLTYADNKIGVIVRVERDTITGKNPGFKEDHYDAVSDFYNEVVNRKYQIVHMNLMEKAGNDPRLDELDKLANNCDNKNIRELIERQVGYIKNITQRTLYESEYILFYTTDLSKIDNIIKEVVDITYKLLDGGYIGYSILRPKDITEMAKEAYGVKYFNPTEATLEMFKSKGLSIRDPFKIRGIVYDDGSVQEIDNNGIFNLNRIASGIINGTYEYQTNAIKNALKVSEYKETNEIEFSNLSDGFEEDNRRGSKGFSLGKRAIRIGKNKVTNTTSNSNESEVAKNQESLTETEDDLIDF